MSIGNVKISPIRVKILIGFLLLGLCIWRYADKIRDCKTSDLVVLANQPCLTTANSLVTTNRFWRTDPKLNKLFWKPVLDGSLVKNKKSVGVRRSLAFFVMILYHTRIWFVKCFL